MGLQRHFQQAAFPAASRVTGRCCTGRDKGPWSWLVMPLSIRACLFCLSLLPPRATTRGRQSHHPLPGLCLLKLSAVTPLGLRAGSEAGDLMGCGITSWILVFAFCCGTPLVFQRRDPQVKSTISPACCSEHQGHPGLGGGVKTWSPRSCLPPGGCVGSVCTCISAKQCDISILSPLSPEKLIPEPVHTLCSIILVILSCPQHALVGSKMVLGHP